MSEMSAPVFICDECKAQYAEYVNGCPKCSEHGLFFSVREDLPSCATCTEIRVKHNGIGPRHSGSRLCESGSIASGGKNAHCTCDWCF